MMRVILLSLLLAAASAFTTPFALQKRQPAVSPSARFILLSDEETDKIITTANDCVGGECSIDEISNLVKELKEQEAILEERLSKVMTMIAHLQHINEKKERKADEVRAFVKDMLRVFAHEKGGFATGFSGDIGDGPKTAYDALPPKKWKAKA